MMTDWKEPSKTIETLGTVGKESPIHSDFVASRCQGGGCVAGDGILKW